MNPLLVFFETFRVARSNRDRPRTASILPTKHFTPVLACAPCGQIGHFAIAVAAHEAHNGFFIMTYMIFKTNQDGEQRHRGGLPTAGR